MHRAAAAFLILLAILTGPFAAALPTPVGAAANEPAKIVFVAANSGPPSSDRLIVRRLDDAGHSVDVVDDDTAFLADLDDEVVLVVVSSSVNPRKLDIDGLRSLEVPVLTWERHLFEDLGLANRAGESTSDETDIEIVDKGHPLAATLEGSPTVMDRPAKLTYGVVGGDAAVAATVVDQPNNAVLFSYGPGSELADGSEAPSCRIAFFATYRGSRHLTDEGLDLAEAAVGAALACDAEPAEGTDPFSLAARLSLDTARSGRS